MSFLKNIIGKSEEAAKDVAHGAEHLAHEAEKVAEKVIAHSDQLKAAADKLPDCPVAKIIMRSMQDGLIVAKVLVQSKDHPNGLLHIVSTYAMDRFGVPKPAEQVVNDLLDQGIVAFKKHMGIN